MKYDDFSKGHVTFSTQFQKEKTSLEEAKIQYRSGGLRHPLLKRGAAAFGRRPLCRFFCSQNSSNCCWRSWIFSFQSFRACQGSQNWAHWGLSKKEYKIPFVRRIICVVSENVNIRFRLYLALRGAKIEKTGPAKPSMSLFENGLLSNSDTGFRIYVKNWLYWYQGHLLRSFLRRAVTHQS